MHQTTYGETHKVKIYQKDSVGDFLREEKDIFDRVKSQKNCLYPNKKIVNDFSVNYLNTFDSSDITSPKYQLKNILREEFDNCEKIYPYLGEVFLNLFFDHKVLKSKHRYLFRKDSYESFLETVDEINAHNITEWIIKNSSLDRAIDIQPSYAENIFINKRDEIFFKLGYDRSFFERNKSLEVKNYRFAIIDGFIESVGEIHHMLHFAAKSKEPHVLFCFGMSDEVKSVIIQNNSKQITQVLPVSMSVNEKTINILNDIAMSHNSDVISSLKGQTISQEMRKTLDVGKKITFKNDGFKIDPVASDHKIRTHINYLYKRINDSPPDANTDLIVERIKNIRGKSLNIHVPKYLSKDVQFNRNLDYILRMMNEKSGVFYKLDLGHKKVMIPPAIYQYSIKKVNTTKDMFYNIDKLIISQEV